MPSEAAKQIVAAKQLDLARSSDFRGYERMDRWVREMTGMGDEGLEPPTSRR
jgi:hypothetical protein